jgi:hypothetical protein
MNIDRMLHCYVDHPDPFRLMLRATTSIVSGSFVLQYFLAACSPHSLPLWFGSDLDVFTTESRLLSWTRYLRRKEGYVRREADTLCSRVSSTSS